MKCTDVNAIIDATPNETPPIGKYGEPWLLGNDGSLRNCNGAPAACHREYIVACVNALAGKNPEALGPFLEAARGLMEYDETTCIGGCDIGEDEEIEVMSAWGNLRSLLAALEVTDGN